MMDLGNVIGGRLLRRADTLLQGHHWYRKHFPSNRYSQRRVDGEETIPNELQRVSTENLLWINGSPTVFP
jgi:hypothetical protein